VRAKLPVGATLVANEIEGIGNAALVGSEFSIVARHLANLTIDASGGREAGASAGTVERMRFSERYEVILQNPNLRHHDLSNVGRAVSAKTTSSSYGACDTSPLLSPVK